MRVFEAEVIGSSGGIQRNVFPMAVRTMGQPTGLQAPDQGRSVSGVDRTMTGQIGWTRV
jgi:hypothetical protein